MCVIGITLNTTTPDGTTITNANGRYRLAGTSTWTNFSINLSNPNTPNITTQGVYELQVNVTNSLGTVSDWADGSFSISESCLGGPCNFDGSFYHYNILSCNGTSTYNIKHPTELTVGGVVYEIEGSTPQNNRQGEITNIDCRKTGNLLINGVTTCPETGNCFLYRVGNDGSPSGGNFTYIACTEFTNEVEVPFGQTVEVCALEGSINLGGGGLTIVNLGTPC